MISSCSKLAKEEYHAEFKLKDLSLLLVGWQARIYSLACAMYSLLAHVFLMAVRLSLFLRALWTTTRRNKGRSLH